MKKFVFKSIIKRPPGLGNWLYADTPIEAMKEFGKKGQISVHGLINGHKFQSSILPHKNGTHYVLIPKEIRKKLNLKNGDKVELTIEAEESENLPEQE